jgi:hypothetical protein
MTPRAIILNDTSGRSHHGCSRVMRLLVDGLQRQGLTVAARSPARHDWAADAAFLAELAAANLVVINGEGTLHHGRPAGDALLAVVDHPARSAPVALVNALWQDNPTSWLGPLSRCALISARDGQSRDAIAEAGLQVRLVPDLSLSAGAEQQPGPREGLIVGDSVRHSTRRALALAARRLGAKALVPTKTRRSALWQTWPSGPLLSGLYHAVAPFGLPPLQLAQNEAAYLAMLGRAAIHLTGRFHAICLSLVTATPVLAVGSNSWKVQALMAEAGLAADRLIPVAALRDLSPEDLVRPYTEAEAQGIAAFLARSKVQAETLFADLSKLARTGAI